MSFYRTEPYVCKKCGETIYSNIDGIYPLHDCASRSSAQSAEKVLDELIKWLIVRPVAHRVTTTEQVLDEIARIQEEFRQQEKKE